MPRSKTLFTKDPEKQHQGDDQQGTALPVPGNRKGAPTTRAECDNLPRPCPYVGCKYHLFMHMAVYGGLKLPFGEDVSAIETMAETCTLDVADSGPQSQYRVSRLLNMTQQSVLQIEQKAMLKVRRYLKDKHYDDADTS